MRAAGREGSEQPAPHGAAPCRPWVSKQAALEPKLSPLAWPGCLQAYRGRRRRRRPVLHRTGLRGGLAHSPVAELPGLTQL